MKKDIQNLPGIKRIGWIPSECLPKRIDLRCICGQEVTVFTQIREISFCGAPECSLTSEKQSHAYSEQASLEFLTAEPLPKIRDVAFIVMDIQGSCYIIGSREEPKAVVKCTRNMGVPAADKAAYTVNVTHNAIKSLVPCKAWLQ